MFKCINTDNSSYFTNKLPGHDHNTRHFSLSQFNTPKYNKTQSQNFFLYQGVKLWNWLPLSIKETKSLAKFKKQIKILLTAST